MIRGNAIGADGKPISKAMAAVMERDAGAFREVLDEVAPFTLEDFEAVAEHVRATEMSKRHGRSSPQS